jgi:hypothetical protein
MTLKELFAIAVALAMLVGLAYLFVKLVNESLFDDDF